MGDVARTDLEAVVPVKGSTQLHMMGSEAVKVGLEFILSDRTGEEELVKASLLEAL